MIEQHLIDAILAGEPDAIAQLRSWIRAAFTPYRSRLANDLDDLEQDILIAFSEALSSGKFAGQSSLRTYLRSHTHHKCLDRLRVHNRREWVDVEDLDLEAGKPSALEHLTRREATTLALQIVQEMPESCRELWQMIHQGMRYSEMSQRVGVSEGTLRARVLRCRRKAIEIRERLLSE